MAKAIYWLRAGHTSTALIAGPEHGVTSVPDSRVRAAQAELVLARPNLDTEYGVSKVLTLARYIDQCALAGTSKSAVIRSVRFKLMMICGAAGTPRVSMVSVVSA